MDKMLKTYALHNYRTIEQINTLPDDMIEAIEVVGRVLPFKTNNYVVDELIDWNDYENDPIFTLTFPRRDMLDKKHYNAVKRLLDAGADKKTLDAKINEIRLSLNPNPAGQEHMYPHSTK